MTTTVVSEMSSTDNILQLNDYLSLQRTHDQNMYFLNLDRRLRQPYVENDTSDNKTIVGVSLVNNYLIQMPTFISDYTNLIELNVSHNELTDVEFILYRPWNNNQLTESYWNEKFKMSDNNPSSREISYLQGTNCRSNKKAVNSDRLKSSTDLFNKRISRPLAHPFLQIINLSFNHIQFLPSNLHYLRFLHTLDLSHNYLQALPTNIGLLEQLTTLLVDHNYLKILPNTFTRLTHLQTLNLSFNHFESIDTLKNLQKLKSFNINSNPLKTFPLLLNTCVNLESISFSNTQLNQLIDITFDYFSEFPKLKKLDLSKNNLSDNFLSLSTKSFDTLEELDLQYNQFTNIFSLTSYMKTLHSLNLNHNSLTHLPECYNSKLEILRLSYNNIEIHPDDCIYLKHVFELDLDHNQITELPNEFLQCLHLQSLNISFNPMAKFPEILLRLRSLNQLIYNHSQIQDLVSRKSFEKYFSRTLNVLDLSNNYLQTNLHELTVLKALTYLDLSCNLLVDLDDDFRVLTCLKILKVNNNKLKEFPKWLYEAADNGNEKYIANTLLELYINDNQITALPDEIVHMINLQTIDLSNNHFATFPDALIYLEQLSSLIYSQQHGIPIDNLPDGFIYLSNLKKLVLSHNTFYEIPQIIYSLTQLEYLDLSSNHLNALENNRLKQLKKLKTIKLKTNHFTSFPSMLYQIESFDISENPQCLAPPNDFIDGNHISAASNLFVQINDQYEENLFQIYKQVIIENLTSYDIERLLIRLKISENDVEHFRKNYSHLKRENKVETLLNIWKQQRNSLANTDTLYKLVQLIGDKNLLKQMRKAYLFSRKIRM